MSFILLGILNSQVTGGAAGAVAYDLLETEILTATVTSVNFTNLVSKYGSEYTNLHLRMTHRHSRSTNSDNVIIKFNGASSGYALHYMYNVSTSVNAGGGANQSIIIAGRQPGTSSNANIFGATVADILDPFDTSKNTTYRSLSTSLDQTNRTIWLFSGVRMSTAAVDSIELSCEGFNFEIGSRFSIYGQRSA